MAAKKIDKDLKRKEIILAALKVFSAKGISSATIKDIAEEANIGKGTVYEYFKSKKEIILSAFSMFLEGGDYSIEMLSNLKEPPDERLKKGLYIFSDAVKKDGVEMFELIFDFWSVGIKEKKYRSEFYNHLKDFYSRYRNTFSDIIKDGQKKGIFNKDISSESIGAMIIGMLDGLMAQWILDGESVDYSDIVKTMAEIIVSGLKINQSEGKIEKK